MTPREFDQPQRQRRLAANLFGAEMLLQPRSQIAATKIVYQLKLAPLRAANLVTSAGSCIQKLAYWPQLLHPQRGDLWLHLQLGSIRLPRNIMRQLLTEPTQLRRTVAQTEVDAMTMAEFQLNIRTRLQMPMDDKIFHHLQMTELQLAFPSRSPWRATEVLAFASSCLSTPRKF